MAPSYTVQPPVQTLVVPATPIVPLTPVTPSLPAAHVERSEKFNGSNVEYWQQKMLFYLTMMNLSRFLKEEAPTVTLDSDKQTVYTADA